MIPSSDDIDREICRRSLADFVRMAWPVLDPGMPYVHGWHIDAICEHLEAVTKGQIKRLLINIPPGTSKSSLAGVYWPAWEWTLKPHIRMINASHEEGLATRDALKMRRLVASDWYQRLWPTSLTGDQNQKTYFENVSTGFRQSCAVKSMTGRRGDRVLLDDPHSVEDAHSKVKLDTATRIFRETLPTRLNDPEKSAIVVIMQRLHEDDVSGLILSKDFDYEHLCLPMEFESDRRCKTSIFIDPRKHDGELLFPERFPREVVERDKKVMGSYAVAGQFQQRPAPREGGMFQRAWFNVVHAIPAGTRFVRGWDFAATKDGGDWTVGAKVGKTKDGRFIIADIVRKQESAAGVERMLVNTASQDGYDVKISIPQDPGQAGKAQATTLIKLLAGYNAKASTETGAKEVRATPLAAQCEAGNVDVLYGAWNDAFFDELEGFPFSSFDDQVDATARAFNELTTGSNFDLSAMT